MEKSLEAFARELSLFDTPIRRHRQEYKGLLQQLYEYRRETTEAYE